MLTVAWALHCFSKASLVNYFLRIKNLYTLLPATSKEIERSEALHTFHLDFERSIKLSWELLKVFISGIVIYGDIASF